MTSKEKLMLRGLFNLFMLFMFLAMLVGSFAGVVTFFFNLVVSL